MATSRHGTHYYHCVCTFNKINFGVYCIGDQSVTNNHIKPLILAAIALIQLYSICIVSLYSIKIILHLNLVRRIITTLESPSCPLKLPIA